MRQRDSGGIDSLLVDAVTTLKAAGHADPMAYTPRQLLAWYRAEQRRRDEVLGQAAIAFRAAQHFDDKSFDKILDKLM